MEGGAGLIDLSKKSKFECLLTLISVASPDFRSIIDALCLEGRFRGRNYSNTVLLPNAELIKEMAARINKDDDQGASQLAQTLILKDSFKSVDAMKAHSGSTATLANGVSIENLSELAQSLKKDARWEAGSHIVYELGPKAPAIKTGKNGGVFGGAYDDYNEEDYEGGDYPSASPASPGDLWSMIKKLSTGEPSQVFSNFKKASAAALTYLQHCADGRFTQAKFFMSDNPILTWFFLTLPGRGDALLQASEALGLAWESVILSDGEDNIFKSAKMDKYDMDLDADRAIATKLRKWICTQVTEKNRWIPAIHTCYKEKLHSRHPTLKKDPELRMLVDELRYMHNAMPVQWAPSCLHALSVIDWKIPGRFLVVTNAELYKNMIMGSEVFSSGPKGFVASPFFLYTPMTREREDQLREAFAKEHKRICGGDDPVDFGRASFMLGGATDDDYYKGGEVTGGGKTKKKASTSAKLASIARALTPAQRKALKALL